ncbi:putative peptidoglycan linked protein [Listeria weihenstephanensis FSL R9-0317]|uniref:immunoglobulin-like domain-containing protein n=1 Tax=Listeria weihenstephanensis TaxID=1006155 RepID=UPI0003E899E7|nr:immunoglobulin-like domain-containing protein [Listeria weihenstephanensis]EUJ35704.1 putative peptidoglycan linked protein [Listeria weihenstephanensis FSL R9-0317]
MVIKKMGVATAALVMCVSLPLQTYVTAAENPQNYSMKAENKLKASQSDNEGSFSDVTDYFSVVPGANSFVDKNTVTITPDASWQKGGLWSSEENKVDLTKNFHLAADLYMGNSPQSADGIAFVMQNDSRGKNALGQDGGGLGVYGQNYIKNALAIEVDSYDNADTFDYGLGKANHIAITVPTAARPVHEAVSRLGTDEIFADGQYHPISFDWDAKTKTLSYAYGAYTGSYVVNDLQATFGGTEVIFGFTGSTGTYKTLQQVEITELQVNGISPKMKMEISDKNGNNNGKAEPSEMVSVATTISNETNDASPFNLQYGVKLDPLFDADTVSNIELKRNDGQIYTVTKEQLLNNEVQLPFADPSNTFTLTYDVKVRPDASPKGTKLEISATGKVNGVKYTAAGSIVLRIPGEKPVITASDSSLKKGMTFDSMAGVSAEDVEDGNLTNNVKITANDVDTSKIGTYHVTYSVTDSDDNTTTKTITVTVTSNDAPIINAVDKSVKKGIIFDPLAGVSGTDTEDGNVTSKVKVTENDVDTSKVGTYHVTYSVTDSDNNTTTKTITVTVTSNDAPTITASDKTLKKGGTFSPLASVTASDVEDGDVTNSIKVTANDVDTSKVGTYHVTYSVTDSDNNTTTKTITVTVTSNDAPIIVATDKTIKKGTVFTPLAGATANDTEDGNVTSSIKVTANDVDTSKVGTYHVTYSVTDSDKNTTTKTITVTVTSNDAPVITATDKTVKKDLTFNPMAGVTANDTEDGDVTSKIQITASDVDITKVGTYHVTYSVTDSDNNTTTKTITVTVTSNAAPSITGVDKTLKKGTAFNPLTSMSAFDLEDGDLTNQIKVTANDVDTSKVGTYHVTYSVTDSDNNTTTKTITVTVTSNDAPVIHATDKTMKKGMSFDPYAGVTATDTEDGDISIKVSITATDVDMNRVGTYHITYSVTDSDKNTTTKTITVTVTSNDAPVIQASDITMRVNKPFNVKEAVVVTDTEDGNITNKLEIVANDVNIAKAGVYHVTYRATDSDGNTTTKTITVTVLTDDAPILTTSDIYLKIGDVFNPMDGITANDTEDGNLTSKIKVDSNDVDMSKAGMYTVVYSVTDSDNNTTKITRHVYVRTNDAPVIHANDLTFKAGAVFDVKAGITASDTEDGDITNEIKIIADDVDATKAGTYHVTYSVTDSDDNTTTKTIIVTVLTNEKPVIDANDITRKAHRPIDRMANVTASDLEDGDITGSIKVVADDVNIDVPGEYHVTYSVIDSDGNVTEKTITVTILSNEKPVITGQDSQFKAGRTFDPLAGISANDAEDGDITSNITVVSNDVNPEIAGVYHVTYSVTDSDGNTTEETYTVTVLTNEKPVIHASDQTLTYGQAFDPMAGVTASDLEDGDITGSITIISNDVNPNQAGIYHVTYSVVDSDGNETQYTITVLVGAQPIVPVVPVEPVKPAKPVVPVATSTPVVSKPGKTIQPVANQVAQITPSKALPKTGDESETNTLVIGGLLAALGALFLRRKK